VGGPVAVKIALGDDFFEIADAVGEFHGWGSFFKSKPTRTTHTRSRPWKGPPTTNALDVFKLRINGMSPRLNP
jgi:hypothetical protein